MMALDLLLHNACIADVFRLRLFEGWIGIRDGRFVFVEEGQPPAPMIAGETRDLNGQILAPGLIDSHMHIESSLITPRRFAEAVVPFGTTTILSDPHEVANVAGEAGVRWMIAASQNLSLRIFHSIPSCVPATSPELEWTSEVFDADVITRLADDPSVIALGEVMDYRGLLGDNERLRGIVLAAQQAGLFVEGHIPTLAGRELSEYLSYGVGSDHTLTFPEKIQEQVSKGLAVMLQTKSITAENVDAVAALPDRSRIILITDDIEPPLLEQGHLSRMVQMAINAGMPPLEALAAATVRPARHLGLRDLGAIAPGYHADFMVMDDLTTYPPGEVFVQGHLAATNGNIIASDCPELPPLPEYPAVPGSLTIEDFRLVVSEDPPEEVIFNAVALQNDRNSLTILEKVQIVIDSGYAVFSEGDDLVLTAIFARNGSSHMVGVLKGTGLTGGAFASSLSHDSHNLLVVGRDVQSMHRAAQAVYDMGGGVAVGHREEVVASLPLPYFGLLSDEAVPQVARDLSAIEDRLRASGMRHQRPFLLLSVIGLSVSPYVKFTDKGIVDTERRCLLPAWEKASIS